MFCEAGPGSIAAHTNDVTLGAVLDPDSPECETYGERVDCDADGNCDHAQSGFVSPQEVTGEWIQPINTAKRVMNETNIFYDPWSETAQRSMLHCNENGGDMMKRGGFYIGFRYFPFDGFATQGWSNYWLRSCNNAYKEK